MFNTMMNTLHSHLVGVLGDDGGVERERPGVAAAELLAGRRRRRGRLPVPRLRQVAVHHAPANRKRDSLIFCSSRVGDYP